MICISDEYNQWYGFHCLREWVIILLQFPISRNICYDTGDEEGYAKYKVFYNGSRSAEIKAYILKAQ